MKHRRIAHDRQAQESSRLRTKDDAPASWIDNLPPGRWEEIVAQLNPDAFIEPMRKLRKQLEDELVSADRANKGD